MIEFKDYQEKAIVKLKSEVNELLESQNDEVVIFKSPTGSGKTLMTAEFLRRLIDARIDGKKFAFVWIAVNKLHDQSRNSLKKYYGGKQQLILSPQLIQKNGGLGIPFNVLGLKKSFAGRWIFGMFLLTLIRNILNIYITRSSMNLLAVFSRKLNLLMLKSSP